MIKINIGSRIKSLRLGKGLNQAQLGSLLGVSDKTISSWEINRTEPNMGMVGKMCEVFQCKKTDIIGKSQYDTLDDVNALCVADLLLNPKYYKAMENLMTLSEARKNDIIDMINMYYRKENPDADA